MRLYGSVHLLEESLRKLHAGLWSDSQFRAIIWGFRRRIPSFI